MKENKVKLDPKFEKWLDKTITWCEKRKAEQPA